MTQARIRAEAFNLEQNWGSTTPGGGCRYELNLAHVCAEVMSHRTRPEEAHFNERRAYTLAWGKGFLEISGTLLGLTQTRLDAWRSFNRTCRAAYCSHCDPTTRSLCSHARGVKMVSLQFTAILNF